LYALAVGGDRVRAEQEARESKAWIAMFDQQRVRHLLTETAHVRSLEELVVSVPIAPSSPNIPRRANSWGFQRRDWLTMNSSPLTSDAAASDRARARVSAIGFSPRTAARRTTRRGDGVGGHRNRHVDDGLGAGGGRERDRVGSRPEGSGRPRSAADRRAASRSRSTMPARSVSGAA